MDGKIRDIMTPNPVGVNYDQTIADAARIMRDTGVGALLVVRDESLGGLVTDRDLVIRGLAEGAAPDQSVGPLCSTKLVGVEADADVTQAQVLMREYGVRRLPVIDGGQIVGMVSVGDLAVAVDSQSPLAAVSRARAST
jgi:CBS domain-containing protein